MRIGRKNKRVWCGIVGLFVATFLFGFLTAKFKNNDIADAANLGNFDAGYIISDYQMSNYNSMSESEIQSFLKSKGNCNDTRTYLADYYTSYFYHIKDGHFVCLADETFGDGTAYGNDAPYGESAAHIIWQAARDYQINPQVLIVLLQKEQGLITDSWPNNRQYRSATGYGCPDTAPCNSEYYGFKNQVRKAAALFRTVLNGGWTNYPLGWNYIQYNPDSDCGGSWVNVRSLGTSALYRYTPYQPNTSALSAGYGSGDSCGAYGNRNFYLYFEDWFGGVTSENRWVKMETPRYMTTNRDTSFYNLTLSGFSGDRIGYGQTYYYTSKTATADNRLCLRTELDEKNNSNNCVLYEHLDDVSLYWNDMDTPRYLERTSNARIIDPVTRREVGIPGQYEYYIKKTGAFDNGMCLKISGGSGNYCVPYSMLKEAEFVRTEMFAPRYLVPRKKNVEIIDPIRDKVIGYLGDNEKVFYSKKIVTPKNEMCLLVDRGSSRYACVRYSDLQETWVEMERPREMRMNTGSFKVNALNLKINNDIYLPFGMVRRFVMKRFMPNNEWCLQTEYDYERKTDDCIKYKELSEI